MKGIVLVSGGLDSTLVFHKLKAEGHTVHPIFVDYGQYAARKESRAVRSSCEVLHPIVLSLRLGLDPSITNTEGKMRGRSMALVGSALLWSSTKVTDISFIAMGMHKGDIGLDCNPDNIIPALTEVVFRSTDGGIEFLHPILEYTTEDVGKELVEIGIPFDKMYNCYWDPPCGFKSLNETYRCPGCRRKQVAMKAAGLPNDEFLQFPNGNKLGRI